MNAGISGFERLEDRQHEAMQSDLADGDGHAAAFQARVFRYFRLTLSDLIKCRFHVNKQLFPLRGKRNSSVGANQQLAAQFRLQVVHGAGDVRLIVSQYGGRLSEAAIFSNIIET